MILLWQWNSQLLSFRFTIDWSSADDLYTESVAPLQDVPSSFGFWVERFCAEVAEENTKRWSSCPVHHQGMQQNLQWSPAFMWHPTISQHLRVLLLFSFFLFCSFDWWKWIEPKVLGCDSEYVLLCHGLVIWGYCCTRSLCTL